MLIFCHPICCHFLKVNDSHNHNTVTRVGTKNNNTSKIRFTRTTQKAALCKRAKHVKYSEHWCKIVQSYCSIQEKNIKLYYWKHIKHELFTHVAMVS